MVREFNAMVLRNGDGERVAGLAELGAERAQGMTGLGGSSPRVSREMEFARPEQRNTGVDDG